MKRRSGQDDHQDIGSRLTSASPDALKGSAVDSPPLALILLTGVLLVATLPHLAPGVCWEDSGDLQAASAMLGIAHPPGYAGYVSLGYVLTRLPIIDPAYVINLACLLSGIAAITLCARLQIRLGVNAWLAAAVCLVFASHPEVWPQLIVPEVYMPSLALGAGIAAAMLAWARTGRQRWLTLAMLLAGFLIANRPPFALTLPVLAVVYFWMNRRRGMRWRRIVLNAALQLAVFALPISYCCAYVWLRDGPDNPYNYIERFRAEQIDFAPAADDGRARFERAVWLLTARQYHGLLVTNIAEVAAQATTIVKRLFVYPTALSIAGIGLAVSGVLLAWRRCAAGALLIAGLAAGALAYCCAYRAIGFAANLLPALFAAAIFSGVGLSRVATSWAPRRGPHFATLLFGAACVWIVWSARERSEAARDADATRFVAAVDLAQLPYGAVVLSEWRTSPPLWYAQNVLAKRPDITVINSDDEWWLFRAKEYLDSTVRPSRDVFFVENIDVPPPYRLFENGGLWELKALQLDSQELNADGGASPRAEPKDSPAPPREARAGYAPNTAGGISLHSV